MTDYLDPKLLERPFDQYQRYRLVAEVMDRFRNPGEKIEILEIGGFHGLVREFLGQDLVMVADLLCDGKDLDLLADAGALPFQAGSFPVVISTDFLEHVRPEHRPDAISQLTSISSELLLIASPFRYELRRQAEQMVFDFIRDWLGYEHKFLKEHLTIDAPDLAETEAALVKAGFDTAVIPSGSLDRWILMMLGYYYFEAMPSAMNIRAEFTRFYNRNYFWADLAEPAYRHLIVASRSRLRAKPDALDSLRQRVRSEPAPDYEKMRLWLEIFRTGELKRTLEKMERIEGELKSKDEQIGHLQSYVNELEDFHQRVKASLPYRAYETLFKGK